MNEIGEKIIGNPDYYYSIAMNYFNEAKTDSDCVDLIAKNHAISYLLHHEFIVTPCIEICLKLFKEEDDLMTIGYYYLYIDSEETFVDEFLVIT